MISCGVMCNACTKMQRPTTTNKVLHLMVLLWVVISPSRSAPVRERRDVTPPTDSLPRWLRPCQGNSQASGPTEHIVTLPPDTTPLHHHWERIVTSADEAKETVQTLMNRYVTERFGDPNFPTYLKEFSLKGMPNVPKKPLLDDGVTVQVEQSLENTYDDLAKIAVFVEVVRKDEYLKQSTTFSSHFVQEIQEIEESHIYNLLCHLEAALHVHNREITTDVTHEVMKAEYREIDNHAARHNRDYIILRDTHKFLDHVSYHFKLIQNQSPSQPTAPL